MFASHQIVPSFNSGRGRSNHCFLEDGIESNKTRFLSVSWFVAKVLVAEMVFGKRSVSSLFAIWNFLFTKYEDFYPVLKKVSTERIKTCLV